MLEAYLKVLDLGYYEVKFAFEGLADENVWKRPAEGLLSVGELAGHIAYWEAVKFAGERGESGPDLAKCRMSSPLIDARSSIKDALLRATRVLLTLNQEVQQGKRIYVADQSGNQSRLLLPDIEAVYGTEWKYLVPHPHSWKRQLFVKGRRLTAANVWFDLQANKMTVEEAAENWGLPVEAIAEIIRYCTVDRALIGLEADEEKRILQEQSIADRALAV